ncbi:MAG: hypothetical protein IH936_16155 [Acidobacteria bacterium]|nr:hypothetical protein [Acidobacteriota bacterium]
MTKTRRKRRSGWIDFAAVKQQVSIEQVLEHYGLLDDLEEKDDGYKGACPMYEHRSKSPFHVTTSKNLWFCHACEEGGNVVDLVVEMEECGAKVAALKLAEWFGIETTSKPQRDGRRRRRRRERLEASDSAGTPENEAVGGSLRDDLAEGKRIAFPESTDLQEEPSAGQAEASANPPLTFELKNLEPGHELLRPLGFDQATVERFEAGVCSRGMMKDRLAVPIHSPAGELLAYAGWCLNGEPGWKFPPKFDRQLELYNAHRARDGVSSATFGLIVVPEILDVWRCFEAGYSNAVAIMDTTMSDHQLAAVPSLTTESQRIVLVLPPGQERDRILSRLADELFVRVAWEVPPHTMQASELARAIA